MDQAVERPTQGDPILSRVVNALIIYAHVYFPTYSNSLKDIGRYLGLQLDCHGGVRPAKHRVEEAVGDHRCSDVKGHAHDLQHGGLSWPYGG